MTQLADIIGEGRIDMILEDKTLSEVPVDLEEITGLGILKETLPLSGKRLEAVKREAEIVKDYCLECGGSGETLPKGITECPLCHKVFSNRLKDARANQTEFPTSIYIPERYRGSDWDKDTAKSNNFQYRLLNLNSKKGDPLVGWLSELDTYLAKIINGTPFGGSCIVSAPNGFGKRHFAYSVIKELYKHKIKSTPITLLNDTSTADDSLMKSPYLILLVTRYFFDDNVNKLDYILNYRRLTDLSTLIITEVPVVKYISTVDEHRLTFDKIIDIYPNL